MPSKFVWFVTCLILMTLPVTGVWMWWVRRPTGQLGLPRRVDTRYSAGLVALITLSSILLPALGLSVVLLLLGERCVMRWRST